MPTGTPRLYLLSLHAALPIFSTGLVGSQAASAGALAIMAVKAAAAFSICPTCFFPMYLQPLAKSDLSGCHILRANRREFKDRKSSRLNSSHVSISYAFFCLKK